jgi:hypothetical protein
MKHVAVADGGWRGTPDIGVLQLQQQPAGCCFLLLDARAATAWLEVVAGPAAWQWCLAAQHTSQLAVSVSGVTYVRPTNVVQMCGLTNTRSKQVHAWLAYTSCLPTHASLSALSVAGVAAVLGEPPVDRPLPPPPAQRIVSMA